MAKKLKVGDTIKGYRITEVFGSGMMAISYAAVAPSGAKVFLKQYKSPAPSVVWYPAFVAYQQTLGARVHGGRAGHFAVQRLDAFEEVWGGRCYFQAFEFVEGGADLQHLLDGEREEHARTGTSPVQSSQVWARHVTWSKVLVSGVGALHDLKVVHADLKPANVYMIDDPTIAAGYQLKLIDMDFSVLADSRAPWHGHQAYIGTDNYRSPEHLTKGGVPTSASDIYTCALILYELLAGYHPYWQEDQADYARLASSHAAKPPGLLGLMPEPADNAEVSLALHRCLSPDPADRLTAPELRAVLSGRTGSAPRAAKTTSIANRPNTETTPGVVPPETAGARPITADKLELQGPEGRKLQLKIRTALGKSLVRTFGDEAEYWDNMQCVLERNTRGEWIVAPGEGTANETLLNGAAIVTPHVLRQGDVIAVGREAKGITKLPLIARGI